ncbi:MAG: hypothetical protein ACK5LC_18115 [Coprobacillaceae bacterium]
MSKFNVTISDEDVAVLLPVYSEVDDTTIVGLEIYFIAPGAVDITIEYDGVTIDTYSVTVEELPIITGLSFDKNEATLAVGESVDLYYDFLPLDGYYMPEGALDAYGDLYLEYSYTSNVKVEPILLTEDEINDLNNEGGRAARTDETYFVGVRVTALAAGTATITLQDENGVLDLAVATITINNSSITPTTPATPTASTSNVVATGDATNFSVHTAMLAVSVLGLGYVIYTKKRNALEK